MSDEDRYRCERCKDDMAAKYQSTHERWCNAFSMIAQAQVQKVIDHAQRGPAAAGDIYFWPSPAE